MIEYENLSKLNEPFFNEYKLNFEETLKSGWFILGKNVETFENEFASYCQTKHCIGVASGLDALILSIKALNLPEKSEIIVPSNTYIATILAIIHNNMIPVLVEPDIKTYNICPTKIKDCITANTRAIIIVHLYGKCCEMDPILNICNDYNLFLIEDCAQAHGATYKGKIAGSFGDFGAFSFYPTKNLGALGDGGAVTTNNSSYYDVIKQLRNYGSIIKYYNERVGYNSRLDEVQAGFLNIKLKKLDEINKHKRKLAEIYLKYLKDDFIKPVVHKDYFDVYHIFNIRHKKRDELRQYLLDNNIKTEVHYPVSPHKQKALQGIFNNKDFPLSEEIHATTLSLPISYFHTEKEIEIVVEILNKFKS